MKHVILDDSAQIGATLTHGRLLGWLFLDPVVSRVWLLVHYPYLLIWTQAILIETCGYDPTPFTNIHKGNIE